MSCSNSSTLYGFTKRPAKSSCVSGSNTGLRLDVIQGRSWPTVRIPAGFLGPRLLKGKVNSDRQRRSAMQARPSNSTHGS